MTTTTTNGHGTPGYALALTLTAALGGLLFGYDTAVISGAVGFLRIFFRLNAAEMGWAASSALVGCVVGAGMAGEIGDRLGRKKALLVSALLYLVSGIWSAIPNTLTEFAFARIVGGVGIGMASLISPLYIAEIAPAHMRGRLVSYNQLAIVLGILGVYFVNYYIAGLGDESWNVTTGWRWMFASGVLPALLFFLLLLRIPESPRFLVQAQRTGPALAVLTRIAGEEKAKAELRDIEAIVARKEEGRARLWSGSARKPFLLGIALAILQQITGINVFMYYAPEIFKQLGSATESALLQTVIVGACNVGFTFVAIRTIDRWGRRPLMIFGSAGMGISLVGLGIVAWTGTIQAWALIFVLGYIACFAMSLGPVVWVVLSEISPTRIRGRAMAVATLLLWTANFVVSQTFPIITENPWLVATFHHAFPFWLYALFCVVTVVLVVTSVPETKGKSLEEIERAWVTRAKGPENA